MSPPPHRHLATGNQLGSIVPTPLYYDKLSKLVLSVAVCFLSLLKRLQSVNVYFAERVTKQKNKKEKKDDSKKEDGKKNGQDKEKSLGDQQTAADPATPPKSEVDSSQVSPQKDSSSSSSSSDNSPIKYVITIDPETEEVTVHTEAISEEEHAEREKAQNEKVKKKPTCQSHPGRVHYKVNKHDAYDEDSVGRLEDEWKLYETPRFVRGARLAIALDCEMGVTMKGESELIRISAVDYFTGYVLLDTLVYPAVPMLHLNTRYSGVSWQMLNHALATRRCLVSREQARQQLWQFVGPETIVMTHGGAADLLALRWIHRRMVDTFHVDGTHENPETGRSLKNLAAVRLNRRIQEGSRGHDSIEDAMACRELTHWYMEHLATRATEAAPATS
ncbi:hypothetical protein N7474_006368 [Penicillium riverlandense]|uniref:uncharacterized protein n=1 Tax=Penicillium riverlandense TaxID=1903569 RepID=UPI0025483810|nr:uncharacterized protein N7474_006368 [Penicillium riverlandense]KAJ5814591.1 hypothetical protein N7474_006368 [Penicillium riverlandense]